MWRLFYFARGFDLRLGTYNTLHRMMIPQPPTPSQTFMRNFSTAHTRRIRRTRATVLLPIKQIVGKQTTSYKPLTALASKTILPRPKVALEVPSNHTQHKETITSKASPSRTITEKKANVAYIPPSLLTKAETKHTSKTHSNRKLFWQIVADPIIENDIIKLNITKVKNFKKETKQRSRLLAATTKIKKERNVIEGLKLKAKLMGSFSHLSQMPAETLPEIAFIGKSNINGLAGT